MIKALLWKEWRTIQYMTLLVIVVLSILPFATVEKNYIDFAMVSIWSLYLLFLGTTSFGVEQNKNNLFFLMTLGVRRTTIWWAKLGIRVVLVTALLMFILRLYSLQITSELLISGTLSLFALGFLMSLFIPQVMTCASATIVMEVALSLLLFEMSFTVVESIMVLLLVFVSGIVYSYRKFSRFNCLSS